MAQSKRSLKGVAVGTAVLASCLGIGIQIAGGQQKPQTPITVYKTATCGCCMSWVEHLRASGFVVTAQNVDDIALIKQANGVPSRVESCHTAVAAGYVIEGHVPADVIQRLLKERPAVVGLAVPGMPVGSPGMEVPGAPHTPYNVVSFDKKGTLTVYESRR